MQCPGCGAEATTGLRYCKQCGANLLEPPVVQLSGRAWASAVWAVALATSVIALGGLGLISATLLDLLRPNYVPSTISPEPVHVAIPILLILMGSLLTFGTVALMLKLFSRVLSLAPQKSESPAAKRPKRSALPRIPAAGFSVTENTTRNFEHHFEEPQR